MSHIDLALFSLLSFILILGNVFKVIFSLIHQEAALFSSNHIARTLWLA